MHKQPLLILFVCFVLGIFFQDYLFLSDCTIYILLTGGFLSLFITVVKSFYFYKFRPVLFGFLAFVIGVFIHSLHSQKPELPLLKGKETITFKITKKLNSNDKNRRYEIDAWKDKAYFKSVLSFPKTEKELNYLHYYKGEVYVNQIEKPYSDFQFDYGKYLSRKGIYFQSYLPNSLQFAKREDLVFSEKVKQRRLETLAKIDHTNLQKRTREFAKGIILADRTEMDQETVRDFRDSGMMHILAISGTHMAIIFGVILLILNFVFPPKYRRYKIVLALLLIWSFAVFIDFGNSVVRSCIMISAYYTFILLQRKTDLLHSMALAGFIILFLNSNQLFEVGFQLSFAAVFGIYWFNQPILKYLPQPKNKFQNFMVNVLSISLSAQLGTIPLVIYYFHQYSAVSILANLVIIPFAEIVIVFSLLIVILISLNLNFSWLNVLYDELISFTLKVIHFFADADSFMQKMIPLTLLEVLLLYLLFYFLRFAIKKITIKNVAKVTYFVLIFVSLRFMLNYRAEKLDEVLVHQFFKEKIISVKEGSAVHFYCGENSNQEKIQQYIIGPYLTSRRTKNFTLTAIPKNISNIEIRGKQYEFNRK
ncbi:MULTISPECIES: ComEC/Rec2 family competence protein [unclassified Kaistella]|uniref:ComEC/Rec2 family competence protein n=1 Tax=unclassified Kaistella TaxID=2762626 RepID=UPI002736DD54|nr:MULTISPECIES: ComEC/Rec2 family competence protein [unclassified Kaistella]MDP2454313.1 ComEC/Rec2 family competence protein [Kaistella sp. SH11-4b]MDP2457800.1 ComEC/Rec2 family competence protein [Kaistella sp. SH40-3]MDP2460706.1 ComEC/Rec2 family competence protein [Kaistella sp. SH19-2b]